MNTDTSGPLSPSPRGYVFDIDGVFHVSMQPVPGASDLLRQLDARAIPFRMLTNATTSTRLTLWRQLASIGVELPLEYIFTAPIATANYVARWFPGAPCYLLAKGNVVDDFLDEGIDIVGPDGEPDAAVVVIGGAEEQLTYDRLNHTYRLLLGGARLVGMHRNISWRTANGMQLDSGPFIYALEKAAAVRATIIGKPSPAIFRQTITDLEIPASQLAMVGDDARNDLLPAKRLGMMTILVRTGKPVGPTEEAMADIVLDSVADLSTLIANSS